MEDITGFQRLSHWVSHYRPPSSENTTQISPSLIVLCTWVAAQPRHISKYVAGYRRLYPHAHIIVIQTWTLDVIVRPTDSAHLSRLLPARDLVFPFLAASPDNQRAGPRILQAFSNGGALSAGLLMTLLRDATGSLCLFDALLFDSCPGRTTYSACARAIITSLELPSYPLPIYLVGVFLAYLGALSVVIGQPFGVDNVVDRICHRLNDPTLVPLHVPRLYLYSHADDLVHWHLVARHSHDARHVGYQVVDELVFQASAHCAHARHDPDRYWGAVSRFVNKACSEAAG